MAGGAVLTPAQLLEQQKKANATMIELEERRLEKMQRRQVTRPFLSQRLRSVGPHLATQLKERHCCWVGRICFKPQSSSLHPCRVTKLEVPGSRMNGPNSTITVCTPVLKAACHVIRLANQSFWVHNRATLGVGHFLLFRRPTAWFAPMPTEATTPIDPLACTQPCTTWC